MHREESRPVAGDNAFSVVLNLDKCRHFVFLRDAIPFREKQDKAIFQLDINGKPHRRRFMEMYFGSACCDAGIIAPARSIIRPSGEAADRTLHDHLGHKFIMAIEGNDVATNLKWIMSTNSVAVMPRPTYETWFMEGRLVPNYHYIEIRSDYSDLEERLHYYATHPEEAEAIVAHAHEYVAQFRDRRRRTARIAARAGEILPLHGAAAVKTRRVRRGVQLRESNGGCRMCGRSRRYGPEARVPENETALKTIRLC